MNYRSAVNFARLILVLPTDKNAALVVLKVLYGGHDMTLTEWVIMCADETKRQTSIVHLESLTESLGHHFVLLQLHWIVIW